MASPTQRSSRTTTSGRTRHDEGRRVKGQSDAQRGTAASGASKSRTNRQSPAGAATQRKRESS